MSIQYRTPGAHPEEDFWEAADAESFVEVTVPLVDNIDAHGLWFVADLPAIADAYLMLHRDIANKSLRKAAIAPDVEVTEAVSDFTGFSCFLHYRL